MKTYKDKLTLGKLVARLEENGILKESITLIREVNDYRITIVHKFFQNNIVVGTLIEAEYVHDYTEKRLIPMIKTTMATNDLLLRTIKIYREDLHSYKKQFNIPIDE